MKRINNKKKLIVGKQKYWNLMPVWVTMNEQLNTCFLIKIIKKIVLYLADINSDKWQIIQLYCMRKMYRGQN